MLFIVILAGSDTHEKECLVTFSDLDTLYTHDYQILMQKLARHDHVVESSHF